MMPQYQRDSLLGATRTLSIGAYVLALLLPAFYEARASLPVMYSFWLPFVGWMGSFWYIEWFANPLIVYSWILVRRNALMNATFASLFAAALILVFLSRKNMMLFGFEGDNQPAITGYGAGYWLWLASTLTMAIGCGVQLARNRFAVSKSLPSPDPK